MKKINYLLIFVTAVNGFQVNHVDRKKKLNLLSIDTKLRRTDLYSNQKPENEINDIDSRPLPSIINQITNFRSNLLSIASENFGLKAKNAVYKMRKGDIVVPLCKDLVQRQLLANKGIYAGVEYEICAFELKQEEIESIEELSVNEREEVIALMKPAYKLRDYLERNDWPVSVEPFRDVPLWVSKNTYEAGTMVATLVLSFNFFVVASLLALLVRITFVPSESMIPSINPGDVTLVTRTIPIGPFKPKVGDVVLFDPPQELNKMVMSITNQENDQFILPKKGEQFIKRIVATPGEVVGVKNAQPYVAIDTKNDSPRRFRVDIVGAYSRPDIFPLSSWDRPAVPLGKKEYFVAGDNGFRSVDSRVWGALDEKYIFGKVQWILWPIKHFGPVKPGQISSIEK